MVGRAGLAGAGFALMLSGCVLTPPEDAETTAADCPVVTKVSAWRNLMPPQPAGGAPLIVQVTFAELSTWQLAREESDDPTLLVLELEPADREAAIATGFRERPRDPDRTAVVIMCAGRELGRDETITAAQ